MATEQFANNAQTTLNGSILAGASTINVASGSGFPSSENFRIKVDSELMLVTTGGSGSTSWTVSRGQEGTSDVAHSDKATVTHLLTADGLTQGILDRAGGGSGYNLVQEEGSNLDQRQTINFIGAAVTAADDSGNNRTNVTLSQSPASSSVVGTGRTLSTTLPLTGGGDLSANRTLAIEFAATQRVLGRNTAGAGAAEEVTLSQLLDWIGSAAHGDILYRGASGWSRLAAGTSGHFLKTQGSGANPAWAAAGGEMGGEMGTFLIVFSDFVARTIRDVPDVPNFLSRMSPISLVPNFLFVFLFFVPADYRRQTPITGR